MRSQNWNLSSKSADPYRGNAKPRRFRARVWRVREPRVVTMHCAVRSIVRCMERIALDRRKSRKYLRQLHQSPRRSYPSTATRVEYIPPRAPSVSHTGMYWIVIYHERSSSERMMGCSSGLSRCYGNRRIFRFYFDQYFFFLTKIKSPCSFGESIFIMIWVLFWAILFFFKKNKKYPDHEDPGYTTSGTGSQDVPDRLS